MGEMAAKLAHQIRTPLSSALLYVGHLGRDDIDPAQRQKFAARLRDRLQHMERQVNDILAFSRSPVAHRETLCISGLVEDAIAIMLPLAERQQAQLRFCDRSGGDLYLAGNPDALLGAFTNLINNALEHGGPGVRVQVELARGTDGRISLAFRDDGPGIPADIRHQVFDPFFTTRSDGTGLGLAVVQSVVLAHQGQVRLDAEEERGATFLIELPAAQSAPADPPSMADLRSLA